MQEQSLPRLSELLRALKGQARSCQSLGSPFTALMCEVLVDVLGRAADMSSYENEDFSSLILRLGNWPGDPTAAHDSVPLRLTGALHALVRRGDVPFLADLYPPAEMPSHANLADASWSALCNHSDFVNSWIDSPPQTNEVGRSAVLGAGLAALETLKPGLRWQLIELGASGGLNLIADQYVLQLSGQTFGDPRSDVSLHPEWTGERLPPSSGLPTIKARFGCDLNPLDLTRNSVRERLLAYIWPDQTQRLHRAEAAIRMISKQPISLDQLSADVFLASKLSEASAPTIIMHSIAWQYFPAEVKAACRASLFEATQEATREAPLAWLGMEADGVQGSAGLRLKVWPAPAGEGASRLLARADFHGRWIEWLDSDELQSRDPGGEIVA